jgi:hypothetical protein
MKYLGAIIALAVSSYSLFAQTEVSSYDKAREVVKHLEALKSCDLSRIWPGYTWENKFNSVLLVSTKESKTFEFDNASSIFREIPFEETPSFALGGFAFNTEGKKTLSYTLDYGETFDAAFRLLVHENFHFFGQDKIGRVAESGRATRADIFPFNPMPRMYRAMVNFYLAETLKNPEQKDDLLSKAKYWNELHKKEFLDDYISTGNLDMTEGSATYAEVLSLSMAKNNCDASKESILKMFFLGPDHVYDFFDISMSDKAGQSYLGGMLAYMIDDLLYQGGFDLKVKAEKNIQPIDELLSSLKPLQTPAHKEIEQSIQEEFLLLNTQTKADVDLFKENKEKGMILISQPSSLEGDEGGSFTVDGFVAVDEVTFGFTEIYQMFQRSFKTPFIKAKFSGVNLYETTQNECGENQLMYWVNETTIENDTLIAKSDVIELAAIRFEQKESMVCIK